jgi:putative ABC transport system substrate-binding protein
MPVRGTNRRAFIAALGRGDEFRQALADAGYVDGRNVAIEFRWANTQLAQLRALAEDLVAHRVAVIVASGGVGAALAAKAATSTIPIVLAGGTDPVRYGLVAKPEPTGRKHHGSDFHPQ